jgi:gamma-glutamyltranspeptidase/glutathione hydrolase
MAATAFASATEAATEILRAGGNAIDAAVAAAWALSVCEPSGSGLGGQTTMLIKFGGGRCIVVEGHSYAPKAVSKERLSRAQQKTGYGACTIPSTPATLGFAQKHYGRLTLEQVMEPAIRLAEQGYTITRLQRRQLNWCRKVLRKNPAAERLFLKDGRAFAVGETFRQKTLAATLRRLARHGVEDFYYGQIAQLIAEDMKRNGGLMTAEDLSQCVLPIEREPISANYRGYEVLTAPAPAGGLQVLLGLKIIEQLISDTSSGDADNWYQVLADTVYAVFHERNNSGIHARDFTPSLCRRLLSEQHAIEIANNMRGSCDEAEVGVNTEEPGETTHLCTADDKGNVVSLTQSIQSLFGAKVANGKLGFLYNNYLSTCPRRQHPHQLGSHCLPRSNVAPTVVLTNNLRPVLALGAAGSRRITSSILQVISNVIDRGMSLEQAMAAPRVHALQSRKIYLERPAATDALCKAFEKRFRKVIIKPAKSYTMASVQAIGFREDDTVAGAADPRRDGTASGVGDID